MSTLPDAENQPRLIAVYLADLERALADADPRERAETLAAVRDHIADALAGHPSPTPEQVQQVLADLGSVEQIASAASPISAVPPPGQEPRWLGAGLLAVSIAALAVAGFVPWLAAAVAIGCLVVAFVTRHRVPRQRRLVRAAAIVSVLTLLASATWAASLLPASNHIQNEPAIPAPSGARS